MERIPEPMSSLWGSLSVLVDPVPGGIISIGIWLISRIGIVALTLLVAVPLGLQLGVIVGNVVFGVLFRARKPKKSYVALCDDVVEHEAKDLKSALLHGPVKDVRIGYRVPSIEYRVSSIEYRVSSTEYRVPSIEYRVSSVLTPSLTGPLARHAQRRLLDDVSPALRLPDYDRLQWVLDSIVR